MLRTYCFLIASVWIGVWATSPAAADSSAASNAAGLFGRLDANADGVVALDEIAADNQRMFKRLLRSGDADGDGKLTRAEFTAAVKPTRPPKPLETARDGRVVGADELTVFVGLMDRNNDGRIVKQEVDDELAEVLEQFQKVGDTDKDGVLTQRELIQRGPQLARISQRAARTADIDFDKELKRLTREGRTLDQPMQRARNRPNQRNANRTAASFARMDKNKDKKLQPAEFPNQASAQFKRRFARMDRDRDGAISQQEFAAAQKMMQRNQQRNQQPAKPQQKKRAK